MQVLVFLVLMFCAVFLARQLRRQRRGLAERTRRYYAVSAPATSLPSLADLRERLERRGYRIAVASHGSTQRNGEHSVYAVLIDQRHPEGSLHFAIDRRGDRLGGELESQDDGPEFYEEMARYAIHALAELIPDLRYASPGNDTKPAESLATELPDEPLGLLL